MSRGSNTFSTAISLQQLVCIIENLKKESRREVEEENKNLKEAWLREVDKENKRNLEKMKQELKEAIKMELSQMASQHSPPVEAPDLQVLVAHVRTKGSYAKAAANPLGEEIGGVMLPTMGL